MLQIAVHSSELLLCVLVCVLAYRVKELCRVSESLELHDGIEIEEPKTTIAKSPSADTLLMMYIDEIFDDGEVITVEDKESTKGRFSSIYNDFSAKLSSNAGRFSTTKVRQESLAS